MFIFAISSRRLPKSQNPNQISDLENVQMDCPDVQACDQETEVFKGLESRLEALQGYVEELSNLNPDDTQGKCYFCPPNISKQFIVE